MGFVARFFLLVLLLSFGELYLLIEVAAKIGLGITLMLCVLTGVLGGGLVRHQGLQTLAAIGKATSAGKLPASEIVSGLILLMVGTLLLTPGFITDCVAFAMLIPPLRKAAAALAVAFFKRRFKLRPTRGGFQAASFTSQSFGRRDANATPIDPSQVIIEVDAEPVEPDSPARS